MMIQLKCYLFKSIIRIRYPTSNRYANILNPIYSKCVYLPLNFLSRLISKANIFI